MVVIVFYWSKNRSILRYKFVPLIHAHYIFAELFYHDLFVVAEIRRFMNGINEWDKPLTKEILKKIEKHWRLKIPEEKFDERSSKEKLYILPMFPYPSGHLHLGHVRVYGTSDVLARYYRMKGKNVLHPIGWDAFGLPAENAALQKGIDPQIWTQQNIADMRTVLKKLNFSFDWEREFATCDPEYYKWTQYFFIKLLEKGLVYRKTALVNWDPIDGTVLADEQVDINGRSWRSGALVEKKPMRQWFIKTSVFAKKLLEGLQNPLLEGWKDIIDIQKHWIGNPNGTTIDFELVGLTQGKENEKISIWMENPEYIKKAKFVAVKSKSFWTLGWPGKDLMPFKVKNPFTGDLLPVYQTDSVSFAEGVEVHLGIPELSEQDKEFADLVNIKYPLEKSSLPREEELLKLREEICAEARARGIGGHPTSSKLKDWLISRQRYWGTPIPIVYCENCGQQAIPYEDLPVRLPKVDLFQKGSNPLEKQSEWIRATCPKCGGSATRETDTMDTFVDSSWYYLRFIDPFNEQAAFDLEKINNLMPVDIYVGGKEHATLHLFYARFMNHFLSSLGMVPHSEPFARFLSQAVVKNLSYKSERTGEYVEEKFVVRKDGNFFHAETEELLIEEWAKMSKSKHNWIKPSSLIEENGVDLTRMHIVGVSSPRSELNWDDNFSRDVFQWKKRLWLTISQFIKLRSLNSEKPKKTEDYRNMEYYIFDSRNFYLNKITRCVEVDLDIGKAIRKMWGFTGSLRKCQPEIIAHSVQYERALATHIILLAPLASFFSSELWAGFTKASNRLSNNGEILWDQPVFYQPWPQVDPDYKALINPAIRNSRQNPSQNESVNQNPVLNKILKCKINRVEKFKNKNNKKHKLLKSDNIC